MRKTFTTIALFAVLGTLAVSCQKENLTEPTAPVVENSATRTIRYTVNGAVYRQVIHSDEDLESLMHTLFALAREGCTVRIMDENTFFSESDTKETLTYTTKKENEAIAWSKEKTLEGYVVTVTFNQQTGEYTCVAIK